MSNVNYDENSNLCVNCTEDRSLKEKIRNNGRRCECSVCGENSDFAITFDILSKWLNDVWCDCFDIGDCYQNFNNDSDHVDYVQNGDQPLLLIPEIIQCDEEDVALSLIKLMSRYDHHRVKNGANPIIANGNNYVLKRIDRGLMDSYWNRYVYELIHHTRFFNRNAIDFLNDLFEEIVNLEVHADENKIDSTIKNFEPGSLKIYRARKSNSDNIINEIIKDPENALSNPPDALATEGRMNPKGISFFYGAEDRETCVAELRPSLGEDAISGEFELIRPVKLLDLTLLSEGFYRNSLSFFDENYLKKRIHRALLKKLHYMIAQPVIDGDYTEYIPTQALAEYLARIRNPKVDGIIFRSVQKDGGRNIALFPHVLHILNISAKENEFNESALKFKSGSLEYHSVKGIQYSITRQPLNKEGFYDVELEDLYLSNEDEF